MKTLTAIAVICTAATFLAFALPEESSKQAKVSDNSVTHKEHAQPCCQEKESASRKSEACGEDCCSNEKTTKGGCLCENVHNTTSTTTTESYTAKCSELSEDECGNTCVSTTATASVSKTDGMKSGNCPEQECKGTCAQCTSVKSESKQKITTGKCELCTEETCKQECSSCAAARNETAGAGNKSAAIKEPSTGRGRGHSGDSQHAKDHQDFFFLIEHRDAIRRTVKNLPNGFESLTESDDPEVAQMIQVHVSAMYDRVENGNPIRMRDPIFRAIFGNANKIKMTVESTDHGVRVTETSSDAYVVKLLQEHARVVSLWMKNGYAELPKNHPAPKR